MTGEETSIDLMTVKYQILNDEAKSLGVDVVVLMVDDDRLDDTETFQYLRSAGRITSLGMLERMRHVLLNKDDSL
jgi:hypothetical protein